MSYSDPLGKGKGSRAPSHAGSAVCAGEREDAIREAVESALDERFAVWQKEQLRIYHQMMGAGAPQMQ